MNTKECQPSLDGERDSSGGRLTTSFRNSPGFARSRITSYIPTLPLSSIPDE
jgi:hypothetical protein